MWKNEETYLKYVWSFFKIMQERVKMTIDDTYLGKKLTFALDGKRQSRMLHQGKRFTLSHQTSTA